MKTILFKTDGLTEYGYRGAKVTVFNTRIDDNGKVRKIRYNRFFVIEYLGETLCGRGSQPSTLWAKVDNLIDNVFVFKLAELFNTARLINSNARKSR